MMSVEVLLLQVTVWTMLPVFCMHAAAICTGSFLPRSSLLHLIDDGPVTNLRAEGVEYARCSMVDARVCILMDLPCLHRCCTSRDICDGVPGISYCCVSS